MAEILKNLLVPLTVLTPLESMRALSRKRDIFPLYHAVSDEDLPHLRHVQYTRKIKTFEKDLELLLKYYRPATLQEYLRDPGKAGEGRMVLTFDDGLRECYEVVAPLLKQKGIPAVFFLNNHFIDNRDLFYRYKASLLVERYTLSENRLQNTEILPGMQRKYVKRALLQITYEQKDLLDSIAKTMEFSFESYLETHPVYLSTDQVKSLIRDGFEIGSHSFDHPGFSRLTHSDVREQVLGSIAELNSRFGKEWRYFSFPFSSDGVPLETVDTLLSADGVEALLGTSGLKNYPHPGFIQRIPFDKSWRSALRILKTEYLYYLLKAPFGKNIYRGGN
ncbi:MAG: polysaccharide deacetylase family protein [Bacteroidales bacterium]|nr:polysaccharide deacetylase family protein [Bacteroidales bacterium]